MASISPVALLVAPLILIAMWRERWAFYLLLGSVPFFNLTVAVLLSHQFNVPEVMMIVFIGHHVVDWLTERRLELRNPTPVLLLWAFLGIAAVSIAWATIWPASIPVHPYDTTFQSRSFVEASVSWKNITQLVLRVFFVLGVTVLASSLPEAGRIETAIRAVVFGAFFVGIVGVAYQVAVTSGLVDVPQILRYIGFRRFPTRPGSLGGIPRMYSTAGEPGFTADYLLYALGLTIPLAVLPGSVSVFTRRGAVAASIVLLGFLVLSTGTTGYGGFLILLGTMAAMIVLVPHLVPSRRVRWGVVVMGFGVTVTTIAIAVSNGWLPAVAERQVQKMTFQAGSGTIRSFYILRSVQVFLERPLLGAGVGTHHAPSYLFTLLAETGVVGAVVLIGAHIVAYRQCTGLLSDTTLRSRPLIAAVAIAGTTLLLTNLLAKSISSLLFPWYWFGLALPIAIVAREYNWEKQSDSEWRCDSD